MFPSTSVSPQKKLKGPNQDVAVNTKMSITCSNVPDALFDTSAAKKHFSKFGRVQRIRLLPKRQMCVIEYEQPIYAERALLNAGAYDGFMFDVTRTKPRVRRKSKRDDDPDWVPDSDVEDELSAMSGAPTYSLRSPKMEVETPVSQPKPKSPQVFKRVIKTQPRKSLTVREKPSVVSQTTSGIESPVSVVTTQTSLSTMEAAAELVQLKSKVSLSPDEQWRTLDARDRILRSWGGAGSRVKVGGATIGTCPDMCPEKELLHRQSEYQLMTLESVPGVDGQPEIRAVKQYSRSSADQEIPMCYELRPASVLMSTCAYLLHEIADTKRQVTLADWFHFMWDRLRGIRKDIAQQALCCSESIILVEMCARFHAHCAARLADLEHTQFDQKLNTDNLTKCLQTLKHMYADVTPEMKPREAEFRGYIALLNLGDANFWWEIKQLPEEIQKSPSIIFAIKIFNALDNNNYVRFFRLITEGATYLQACILLRYFNDVRARALARIVKAYAPRGGSRYPIVDLMNALAFESEVSAISFVNHYGLRSSKIDDCEPAVVLDRNQFIEDSDPYPLARAVDLIESKRVGTVAEVIAGGQLPKADFYNHVNYTSFTKDGKLKETALVAEDQGYNTVNDTNKVLQALKSEIQRLMQSGKKTVLTEKHIPPRATLFKEPEPKRFAPKDTSVTQNDKRLFAFTPAIPVAPAEEIKQLPPISFGEQSKNMYSFSKPQQTFESNNLFLEKMKKASESLSGTEAHSIFSFSKPQETHGSSNVFSTSDSVAKSVFGKSSESKGLLESKTLFKNEKSEDRVFKKPDVSKPLFGQPIESKQGDKSNSLFGNVAQNKLFTKPDDNVDGKSMFANRGLFSQANSNNLFGKPDTTVKHQNSNIFTKSVPEPGKDNTKQPSNIFGAFSKLPEASSIFGKSETMNGQTTGQTQSIFAPNGEINSKLSPSSLFKSAVNPLNGPESKTYTVFQSKNKAQSVADNILHSINNSSNDSPYEFKINQSEEHLDEQYLNERRKKEEEMILLEQLRKEEEKKQILLRQEEERRKAKADELRKREELKQLEAKRREEERRLEARRKAEEERKQEELRKKLEEEKKAEIKRREEQDKKFKQRVDNESGQTIEELINEVNHETVQVIMKEKVQEFTNLLKFAGNLTEEIIGELCNEMCCSEMKAEKFLTKKLMHKWYHIWRLQYLRNRKRRDLLEDTPVWLPENNTLQEASRLRRPVEPAALRNMNAIHRGYRFKGELRLLPSPEPYNIMEIIRSSLLKRMRQINYLYDKCFFWKVTIVSPGENKWLYRRINTEKWIMDAFSDKKNHEASQSLIHVSKQSWNHLMDFGISVSLISKSAQMDCSEATEGSNGILIYSTEEDYDIVGTIKNTLQHKYPYQIIPVTVVLPKMEDKNVYNAVDALLKSYVQNNYIAGFKIYMIDSSNLSESLNACTKSALKWMARNCPRNPPLEIDYLKSLCQRYLGNEIWCQLKSEQDVRMQFVRKDLHKLVSCYNTAVDKLTEVITEEDLFNYSPFPLEFKMYLDDTSPYPKPHEFIPSSVSNSENTSTIRNVMQMLKLPSVPSQFNPRSVTNIQDQMRIYCNQIGWFENPEEVVCKVVAVSSNELSDFNLSREDFTKFMEHYNFIDFLNIIVYEKISKLKNISNQFAIYKKHVLDEYRNINWLYETRMLSEIKNKLFVYEEDELDYLIEAKRRKIALDSMEYLMLEDKDSTIVEENIKATDESITKYNDCEEAVKQLEEQLEVEKMKSMEFENMLKAALSDC